MNSFVAKTRKEALNLWDNNLPDLSVLTSKISGRGDCLIKLKQSTYSFTVYPANGVVIFHLDFKYIHSLLGFEISLHYFKDGKNHVGKLFAPSLNIREYKWIVSPSDICNVHPAIDFLISDLNKISGSWWEFDWDQLISYLTQTKEIWKAHLIPLITLTSHISQQKDFMVTLDESKYSFKVYPNNHNTDFFLDFHYNPHSLGFEVALYHKFENITDHWILFRNYNGNSNTDWVVSPTDIMQNHLILEYLLKALSAISKIPADWKKAELRLQILQSLISNKLVSLKKKNRFSVKTGGFSIKEWNKIKIGAKSLSGLFHLSIEVDDSEWEKKLNEFLELENSFSPAIKTLSEIKGKISIISERIDTSEKPFDSVILQINSCDWEEVDGEEITRGILRNLPKEYRTRQKVIGVKNNISSNISSTSDTFLIKEEILEPENIDITKIPPVVFLKTAIKDVFPGGCRILQPQNSEKYRISLCISEDVWLQISWKEREDFIKSYPYLLRFHETQVAPFLRGNPYVTIQIANKLSQTR